LSKPIGLKYIHTDPDRLRKPLIRIRKNPDKKSVDDEWVEVDWEEALNFASTNLAEIHKEYGRDSIGSYMGRSTAHNIGALLAVAPLRKVIGSRNIYTGSTVDQMPHNFVWHHMLGHQLLVPVPDINHTVYFLMLGTNPNISKGAMMSTGAKKHRKYLLSSKNSDKFSYSAVHEKTNQ
jgi:anaerobic selenocysteine-containing dehydrogenase